MFQIFGNLDITQCSTRTMFTARTMFTVHVHGAHSEVSQPPQRSRARGSNVERLPRKCTINHFRMLHFVCTTTSNQIHASFQISSLGSQYEKAIISQMISMDIADALTDNLDICRKILSKVVEPIL